MDKTADNRDIFDITFVGAGPVALYGMYYAGLRRTTVKAIDMLEDVDDVQNVYSCGSKVYLTSMRDSMAKPTAVLPEPADPLGEGFLI